MSVRFHLMITIKEHIYTFDALLSHLLVAHEKKGCAIASYNKNILLGGYHIRDTLRKRER